MGIAEHELDSILNQFIHSDGGTVAESASNLEGYSIPPLCIFNPMLAPCVIMTKLNKKDSMLQETLISGRIIGKKFSQTFSPSGFESQLLL